MPPVAAFPLIGGAALSIAITLLGLPFVGAFGGGALAAILARTAPVYHGALVGVATVLAMVALPGTGPDDFALILLWDAGLLAAATVGALLASRLPRSARPS